MMENNEELMTEKLSSNKKTGYLNEDFHLFHIKDKKNQVFDYHYHDFHKIVIPLSGDITYFVEGKTYYLKPFDVLLVSRFDIHKPVIGTDRAYERIVIWIKNEFIEKQQLNEDDITMCFTNAAQRGHGLLRMQTDIKIQIQELLFQLEHSMESPEFASALLSTTYFLQLMIHINRISQNYDCGEDTSSFKYDRQIEEVLKYINNNLIEDLSNDALADRFFLSKYHLMHKFKKETGYTLHSYIEQKRLVHASANIQKGIPVMKAALECGFLDYSTFLRAFRKKYGSSPREYFNL